MDEAEGKQVLHEGFPWTRRLSNWQRWVPAPDSPQQEPGSEFVELCLTYRSHPLKLRVYRQGAVYRLQGREWTPLEPSAPVDL